ncbi:MAG: hypothetical protein V7K48_00180 [Nostoc sp.]|uniref:hypothetical protein n=1 Tax=Nostoc sp. TaxID=1180 RepID=UPI002FF84697
MSFVLERLGSSVTQYERLVLSLRLWLGVWVVNKSQERRLLFSFLNSVNCIRPATELVPITDNYQDEPRAI